MVRSDNLAKRGGLRGVEVNGESILGVLDGMGSFRQRGFALLEDQGIVDPKPNLWYPLESFLAVLQHVLETIGPMTLAQIGARVINSAVWPDNVDSFEEALRSIDIAYHMNHRRDGKSLYDPRTGEIIEGGIGHDYFIAPRGGERVARYVAGTFYPCDFDIGMVRALARRFPPEEAALILVEHDSATRCRKVGGETCTYLIKW